MEDSGRFSMHHNSTDPLKLANVALEAMRQEYEGLETEEVRETLAGREMVGYDLNFFLFDFTSTAQIRGLQM